MRPQAALVVLVLGACATSPPPAPPAPAAQPPATPAPSHDRRQGAVQVVTDTGPEHQPTTEAVIRERLDRTLDGVPANATASRIALADITYPRSQAELKGMGGFALLLITAITHDRGELPIDHAEVRIGDTTAKLVEVTSRRSEVPAGRHADVFGRFRQDAVYLIPVFATQARAEVVAYLGFGKLSLTLLKLSPPAPGQSQVGGLDYDFEPQNPQLDVLRRLLDEELPVIGSSGLRR
jgi:hypothetical protein